MYARLASRRARDQGPGHQHYHCGRQQTHKYSRSHGCQGSRIAALHCARSAEVNNTKSECSVNLSRTLQLQGADFGFQIRVDVLDKDYLLVIVVRTAPGRWRGVVAHGEYNASLGFRVDPRMELLVDTG